MSTISSSTTSTTGFVVTSNTAGTLVLQTGSTPTTAVTIDASQNMGLGVTPSTWGGNTSKVLEFANGVSFLGNLAVPAAYVNTNAISSTGGSSWTYKSTNPATQYLQFNGQHIWQYAPSGTAGNAIAFTQAMTLTADGNLGIGTTSPGAPLHARGSSILSANSRNLKSWIGGASSWGNNSSEELGVGYSGIRSIYTGGDDWALTFATGTSAQFNAGTQPERARIDAGGRLGIGVIPYSSVGGNGANLQIGNPLSNSGSGLTIGATATGDIQFSRAASGAGQYAGLIRYDLSSDFMAFWTNSSERVRIGSTGGVSIAGGLAVGTNTLFPTNIFFAGAVLTASAGTFPLRWNSSSGIVSYDTSSRLVKTNIEDSPYGLAEVLQLKSRKYQRIDSEQNEIGLIADEVELVMPEFVPFVAKSIFTKDEADTEMIAGGVNYDKMTSVLIKAIQEQQSIIETLTNRISALENK